HVAKTEVEHGRRLDRLGYGHGLARKVGLGVDGRERGFFPESETVLEVGTVVRQAENGRPELMRVRRPGTTFGRRIDHRVVIAKTEDPARLDLEPRTRSHLVHHDLGLVFRSVEVRLVAAGDS